MWMVSCSGGAYTAEAALCLVSFYTLLRRPFSSTSAIREQLTVGCACADAGIDSAPANLESTCFALARGLDLYLTRVQPSKTFDLLPEDFPFALLVAITIAMIAASVALKFMSERTSLKQKWA